MLSDPQCVTSRTDKVRDAPKSNEQTKALTYFHPQKHNNNNKSSFTRSTLSTFSPPSGTKKIIYISIQIDKISTKKQSPSERHNANSSEWAREETGGAYLGPFAVPRAEGDYDPRRNTTLTSNLPPRSLRDYLCRLRVSPLRFTYTEREEEEAEEREREEEVDEREREEENEDEKEEDEEKENEKEEDEEKQEEGRRRERGRGTEIKGG